jgi:tRNA threonylcarbamoyladenosine biosynthesis protein TsaE
MIKEIKNEIEMKRFGEMLGSYLFGGAIVELIGDVGSGKTTLTKGIAAGLGVEDDVQSPSFTIKRVYDARDHLILAHYDFYRLMDAGIMMNEIEESLNDSNCITIIEWGEIIEGVLPTDRLSIKITAPTEDSRELVIDANGEKSQKILDCLSV